MTTASDGTSLSSLHESQPAKRDVRRWYVLAVAGIALMIGLRLLLIAVPLERDEGGYAYIADRWLHGETPYVHALETKPPGVFVAYAVILQFGRSVQAIRAAAIAVAVITALLFGWLAHRAYGARTGCLATALTALLMISPKYLGFTLNAEMVMVPFVLGAFLCLPIGTPPRGYGAYLLCGALLGVAALVKPVAMTEGLPLAAVIVFGDGHPRRRLLRLLAVGAGFAAMIALCVAWFASQHAAREMIFWSFLYNLQYSTDLSVAERIQALFSLMQLRGFALRDWPIWLAAALGVVALVRSPRPLVLRVFPLLWLTSSLLGTSASGRWTGHYFQQCLPAIGLLAALGVGRLLDAVGAQRGALLYRRGAAGVILALVLLYPPLVEARYYLAGPQLARMMYGFNPFMEGEAVGRYLAAHTAPDDTVFVFGSEGKFLFHAERRSATRFVFTYPLGSSHPRALQWQRETLEEVRRNNPRYIVVVNARASFYLTDRAPRFLRTEIGKMMATQYVREAAVLLVNTLAGTRDTAFVAGNPPPTNWAPALVDIMVRKPPPGS
jgi:hypothetical protein